MSYYLEPAEKYNNSNKISQWLEKAGQKHIIEKRFMSTGKSVAKHKIDKGPERDVMVQHKTVLPKKKQDTRFLI